MSEPQVLRVANCSGFYGDRLSAAREMVEGGPIDILTGDWLAELTMLVLHKDRERRPSGGYARTFLHQMREVLATCVERGIKVVSNAGGLNPGGLADALRDLADELDLDVRIAWVEGDDLTDEIPGLSERTGLVNLDTDERLGSTGLKAVTANAYLGASGIAAALGQGADIVITGRVTDAAVVLGPAIWRFGWTAANLDELAGAVVAGHVIECGCQATGGNFSFFDEIDDLEHAGFPLAEIHADGSSVITKHPGTGGAVTTETVTAQLLYEITSARYANPDVVTRLDTVRLTQDGPDRVRISGVRGEPAPDRLKLAINLHGGYRNEMMLGGTGLHAAQKAEVATRALWHHFPHGAASFERTDVRFVPSAPDPARPQDAWYLRISVFDSDPDKVGRAFSSAVVENALAVYPGHFTATRPGAASAYGIYWPCLIDRGEVTQTIHVDGVATVVPVDLPAGADSGVLPEEPAAPPAGVPASDDPRRAPLGIVAGARSGDKGGNANLGVWGRTDEAYAWLRSWLTVERLVELVPELDGHAVRRYELPNIRGLNFVIDGLLGRGVAASERWDRQAKTLGEQLRAATTDIPRSVIVTTSRGADLVSDH